MGRPWRVLAVVALFAGAPLLVDERLVGYGGALPMRDWETGASSNAEDAALAIDVAGETAWVGELDAEGGWWLRLDEPRTVTGVLADTGNSWRTTIEPHLVVRGPGGARPEPPWGYASERTFYSWHRLRAIPALAETITLRPRGPQTSTPTGRWALREVRVLTDARWVVDREAYPAALARAAVPFGLALLWVLLAPRRRPASRSEAVAGETRDGARPLA